MDQHPRNPDPPVVTAVSGDTSTSARLSERLAKSERAQRAMLAQIRDLRRQISDEACAQQNFVRMISHELLTPITAMELSLRLIERLSEVTGSKPLVEAVARIASSSRRLHQVVETMTAWSRIRSGEQTAAHEAVDLEAMVTAIVDASRPYAARKGLVLRCRGAGVPVVVETDPGLVALVVGNLVTRALQGSNEGTVEVKVVAAGDLPRIEVTDTAPPIRELGDVFDRLSSPTKLRQSGAGPGLSPSILRDLAVALGGALTIEAKAVLGNTAILWPNAKPISVGSQTTDERHGTP